MAITYLPITDREIQDRVRYKHLVDITELKRLGFQEFYFFNENVGALGFSPDGLSGFLGMFVALFKEVATIESNMSISIFNLALACREQATYAGPFGLGVKFYTSFTDGTCIISGNFKTPAVNHDKEKFYKIGAQRSIETAWSDHQRWVNKFCLEGKQKNEHLSFAGFQKLVQQEDSYMLLIR